MPAVEVEPLGEAAALFWMLALLFRLEPKPRLLKRELMTFDELSRDQRAWWGEEREVEEKREKRRERVYEGESVSEIEKRVSRWRRGGVRWEEREGQA